jgi:protein PET100
MFNNALRKLSGSNLEVFKVSSKLPILSFSINSVSNCLSKHLQQFGIYILFPIGWMYYFGTNLEERFSVPGFWPKQEHSHKIPVDIEEIDRELARMKRQRAFRQEREQKLVAQAAGESASAEN